MNCKKIITFIVSGMLLLPVFGGRVYAVGNSYVPGTVSGTSWESDWLGMRLELPEGFEFQDVEEFFDEIHKKRRQNSNVCFHVFW